MQVDHVDGEQRLVPGDATFYQTGRPFDYDLQNVGLQVLRLPSGRLEQLAEDLTDVPAAQVHFDSGTPVSDHAHRWWVDTFMYISKVLHGYDTEALAPLMVEEMARMLVAAALQTFPNTTMPVISKPSSSSRQNVVRSGQANVA